MSNIAMTELTAAAPLSASAIIPETTRIVQEGYGMPSPTAQPRIKVATREMRTVVARRRRIRVDEEGTGLSTNSKERINMKNHISKFITSVWRAFPVKCVAATIGLLMVCLNCNAQGLQTIKVQGKDSSWRLVGSVEPMTTFQIGAKGKVDFGGFMQDDSPNAGVTGNSFTKWCRDNWGSIETALKDIAEVVVAILTVSGSSSTSTGFGPSLVDHIRDNGYTVNYGREAFFPGGSSPVPTVAHWNWTDYINDNAHTVNYDEGAFFVGITTNDQPPSQGDSANQVAEPALYYWYNRLNKAGIDIAYDKKVWVWVKVHDGGRNPFSTSSFGDNHGAYTVWVDPDSKITNNDLNLIDVPMKPIIGGSGFSAEAFIAHGKAHHVATVLKRKTQNNSPE